MLAEVGLSCEVTVFSAKSYWMIAADAAERARKQQAAWPEDPSSETTVAIIMAAVAAEAFINELPTNIRLLSEGGPSAARWAGIADAMDSLEEGNAQIVPKYLISALLLGSTLDKEGQPFEEFRRLANLRNALVHQKVMTEKVTVGSDGEVSAPHRMVDFFEQRKMTHRGGGVHIAGWANRIGTDKVARWACRASACIVMEIVNRLVGGSGDDGHPFPELLDEWRTALTDPRILD